MNDDTLVYGHGQDIMKTQCSGQKIPMTVSSRYDFIRDSHELDNDDVVSSQSIEKEFSH